MIILDIVLILVQLSFTFDPWKEIESGLQSDKFSTSDSRNGG